MIKTILVCTNMYPPNFIGGAELIAHYHGRVLAQKGYRVIVFTGEVSDSRARYSIRRDNYDGLPVYRCQLQSKDFSVQGVNFHKAEIDDQFDELLESHTPDVVHMHNLNGLSLGMIARAQRRNIKTVLTLHDHWGFCFKNTLINQADQVCRDYSRCADCMPYFETEDGNRLPIRLRRDYILSQLAEVDTLVSPSHYLAQAYLDAGAAVHKLRVIPNGIDTKKFAGITKKSCGGKVRFTLVGHLGSHKGLQVLLKAASLVSEREKIMLNFVGDGELRDELQRETLQGGLESQVRFWGKVDNAEIPRVYEETDVCVIASIWPENAPVSITEAFASHTPVLASRIGGIPELVIDGHNGRLFEAGNAADLAEGMMWFVSHQEDIQRLGSDAYATVEANTFERQVERILRMYEEPKGFAVRDPSRECKILCVGEKMDGRCIKVVEQLSRDPRYNNWRFLMRRWLSPEQARRADLVWVVDPAVTSGDLEDLSLAGERLLAPWENSELSGLCSGGLCYRSAKDARAMLDALAGEIIETGPGHRFRAMTA